MIPELGDLVNIGIVPQILKRENTMKTMTEVMPILKAIRREKKISIQQVVEYIQQEARIEVATKTVYGWENLCSTPSVMCFVAMCKLYEIQNIHGLFSEERESLLREAALKDELYDAYIKRKDVQNAVDELSDLKSDKDFDMN